MSDAPEIRESPTFEKRGAGWRATWPTSRYRASVSRIHESSRGEFRGEVYWQAEDDGEWLRLHQSTLNLLSDSAKRTLTGQLKSRSNGIDWGVAVEQLCQLTIEAQRNGEPVINLATHKPSAPSPWLIPHFLPRGQTTVLFGDGGSEKSLLAMHTAISLVTGLPWCNQHIPAHVGPVLYLDWEDDADGHQERLRRLSQGMGLTSLPEVLYRRMTGPVIAQAERIAELIAEHKAIAAIIDSLGWAGAGELNDSGLAIPTMDALRVIGSTILALAHETKAAAQGRNSKVSIFGSQFFKNAARCVWHADNKDDGTDTNIVKLSNLKMNNDRLQPPMWIATRFSPRPGPITVDLADSRALALAQEGQKPLSAGERVCKLLEKGPATRSSIQSALGMVDNTVNSVLQRLRKDNTIVQLPADHANPNAPRYALPGEDFAGQPAVMDLSEDDDVSFD